MKIYRDGKEYELTFSEMVQANEEYELDCMIEDVKSQYEQDEHDVELSKEQIEEVANIAINSLSKNDSYFEAYWANVRYALDDYIDHLSVDVEKKKSMSNKNKYEELFEQYMDLVEFTLVKHKDGWGIYDRQGANLGDIEGDRFKNAADIFDRMGVYINDYFFEDLENELGVYEIDMEGRETPWNATQWLELRSDIEFYNEHKKYFDNHTFEFDVLDMIANHTDDINLENVYYEED